MIIAIVINVSDHTALKKSCLLDIQNDLIYKTFNIQNAKMDCTYNAKIAAVKLKHLSGLVL